MLLRSLLAVVPVAVLIGAADPASADTHVKANAPPEGIRVTLNCRNEPSGGALYTLRKVGLYTQLYEPFTIGCGETVTHVPTTPDYVIEGIDAGMGFGVTRCATLPVLIHERYTCDRLTLSVK
jgi:hypothetical protein